MNWKTGVLLTFFLFLCLVMSPAKVSAQEVVPTPSDDEVNAVAHDLYCPVCDNVPLDVCGTQACDQWRNMIRQELASGKTAQEIQQNFAAQYGEQVLAEPSRTGINRLFYILPAAFVIGSILYAGWVYIPRKSNMVVKPEPQMGNHEEIDQMEEALRDYQMKSSHRQ